MSLAGWLSIAAQLAVRLPILAALAWIGASDSAAQPEANLRHVLILYPYDRRLPATNIVGEEVTKTLLASNAPIGIFSDYLDLSRFEGVDHRQHLAEFLAKKYASLRIDLVVALGPPALEFIEANRDSIAPGAKIVFGLVSGDNPAGSRLPHGDVLGITSDYDLPKTMELAAALQPDARSIVVVSGSSDFDREWEVTAREDLAPFADRYAITYLGDLPFNQILESVSRVPEDTIVLVLSVFEDATGRRFTPREAAGEIARAAGAPSYAPYDTYIGLGFVGGYTDTFESTGVALGELALDVLSSKEGLAAEQRNPEHTFRVDARELKRWGLSRANLPQDTVVLFDEKTAWERYWYVTVAASVVIAVQFALIAALVIQHARRRRAEAARMEAEQDAALQRREVAHMSRALVLGELAGTIAHELNQPLTAILANAQAAQMLLGRRVPDIDQALAALREIVEDDNRAGQVIQRLHSLLKKDESRWESIDANDIVRSTYNLVHSELVSRRIDARLQLASALAPLRGDPVQLQQVLLNLIVNAMDALAANEPGRRSIVVRTRTVDRRVELSVIDSGPGISPAQETQLFQPFFTTKSRGLGLGLSVCSTILNAHGGRLMLSSGEQGGAVATVVLPSVEMKAAAE